MRLPNESMQVAGYFFNKYRMQTIHWRLSVDVGVQILQTIECKGIQQKILWISWVQRIGRQKTQRNDDQIFPFCWQYFINLSNNIITTVEWTLEIIQKVQKSNGVSNSLKIFFNIFRDLGAGLLKFHNASIFCFQFWLFAVLKKVSSKFEW